MSHTFLSSLGPLLSVFFSICYHLQFTRISSLIGRHLRFTLLSLLIKWFKAFVASHVTISPLLAYLDRRGLGANPCDLTSTIYKLTIGSHSSHLFNLSKFLINFQYSVNHLLNLKFRWFNVGLSPIKIAKINKLMCPIAMHKHASSAIINER